MPYGSVLDEMGLTGDGATPQAQPDADTERRIAELQSIIFSQPQLPERPQSVVPLREQAPQERAATILAALGDVFSAYRAGRGKPTFGGRALEGLNASRYGEASRDYEDAASRAIGEHRVQTARASDELGQLRGEQRERREDFRDELRYQRETKRREQAQLEDFLDSHADAVGQYPDLREKWAGVRSLAQGRQLLGEATERTEAKKKAERDREFQRLSSRGEERPKVSEADQEALLQWLTGIDAVVRGYAGEDGKPVPPLSERLRAPMVSPEGEARPQTIREGLSMIDREVDDFRRDVENLAQTLPEEALQAYVAKWERYVKPVLIERREEIVNQVAAENKAKRKASEQARTRSRERADISRFGPSYVPRVPRP